MKKILTTKNIIIACVTAALLITIGILVVTRSKKSNAEENGTEIVMTETDAVAMNEKGELIDPATGQKLTEEEIKKLTEEGVVEETKDGKTKINEDKNKKNVKVTVDKDGNVVADAKNTDQNKKTTTEAKKQENTTEAKKSGGSENPTEAKKETTTEAKQESTTAAPKKENTTEAPKQENTTEAKKQDTTEAPKQDTTEAPKSCSHNWVWKTHTETIHHDAVTHVEEAWSDPWDEDIYVEKTKCNGCGQLYNSGAELRANDTCGCNYYNVQVYDHTEHHPAELIESHTVVDQEAYDEYVEVKDYQYCSKCGEKK